MRKFFWCILFALLLQGGVLEAQQAVQIGGHSIALDQNLRQLRAKRTRGAGAAMADLLPVGGQVGGEYFALIQFDAPPLQAERAKLTQLGVTLLDYVGGDAYYVRVRQDVQPVELANAGACALAPLKEEWKVDARLLNDPPAWVQDGGEGMLRVDVHYFPVDRNLIIAELGEMGYTGVQFSEVLRSFELLVSQADLSRLAAKPWVMRVSPVPAPQELYNYRSRILNRSNVLQKATSLGGRGLSGRGVKVGVWDGNVEYHVDYGNRLHIQEFETTVKSSGSHGMHVSGTVAGAGLLDPKARGMAPNATLYTYNFNKQRNGKREHEEMLEAQRQFGISLTQNSYGPALGNLCRYLDQLSYDATGADLTMDALTQRIPTLTLVYAAGNDAGECGLYYGTIVRRAKNIIYVGALNENGGMTNFSSWGPHDDGRLAPTISAMGENVYSCVSPNSYEEMSGTSMACPATTGTLALITERYHQLHNGAEPPSALLRALIANTADDAGRWGPDYVYGYGVLNGERAVESLEKGWYVHGEPLRAKDPARTHAIQVPAGTARLRVMITWNDTVSAKEYAYREPALINDLDLQLELAGKRYLPWVLDPKSPRKSAVRGVDRLNNIEQITIENPTAGLCNISVLPSRVVSAKQDYVLTWYFESSALHLTSPNGGEVYEPGEPCKVMWDKIYQPVSIDISQDGGATYTTLVEGVSKNCATITIPAQAKPTGKAKIRLRMADAMDESDAPFTIMPAPKNVRLKAADCSSAGWEIAWDGVPEPVQGYKILKANVPAGTYDVIGQAEASTLSYKLQPKDISSDQQNVFTVRAVGPDGIESERAVARLMRNTTPIAKRTSGVLLDETFVNYPSQYIQIDSANNLQFGLDPYYREQSGASYPSGSHVLNIMAKYNASKDIWPVGQFPKEFKPEQNANGIRLRMCDVDLTGVAGKTVILAIEKRQRFKGDPLHSVFKVEVNGETLHDMDNATIAIAAVSGDTPSYYDLTRFAGQKITVDMYYAARIQYVDKIFIDRVKIYVPEKESDLKLLSISVPKSAANLGEETVGVMLFNDGYRTVEGAKLRYQVNEDAANYLTLPTLKPFERKLLHLPKPIDFSSSDPLGKRFDVVMEVIDAHDKDATNNKKSAIVVNFGKTYPHPFSQAITGYLGTFPSDPLAVKRVERSFVYTDAGGIGGDYPNIQGSTVHFLPSKPGHVVEITFKSFESEKNKDLLGVFTSYKQENWEIPNSYQPEAILTGTLKEPVTYMSQNPDGSLAVYFRSDAANSAAGWVAEVREVEPVNLYELVSVGTDQKFHADGKVPIVIKVRNLSGRELTNTQVAYSLNASDEWTQEVIPSIAPQAEVSYTFKRMADLKVARWAKLTATIRSADFKVSDNTLSTRVMNDRYCNDRVYGRYGDCILAVRDANQRWTLPVDQESYAYPSHDYATDTEFTMYRESGRGDLFVSTDKFSEPGNFRIWAWVDWNNDGEFDTDTELTELEPEAGRTHYHMTIKIPSDAVTGKVRLRMATSHMAYSEPCSRIQSSGNMVDLTINLLEGANPVKGDLAPAAIVARSAMQLTEQETVKVWIANRAASDREIGWLTMTIDDRQPVREMAQMVVPAFDSVEYTFEQKVDLSSVGLHRIRVAVVGDDNTANDELESPVYSVIPGPENFYALNFREDSKTAEVIDCGTLGGVDLRTVTYEAWVNLRPTSLNNLFLGKGVVVTMFDRPGSKVAPRNSLLVLINERRLFHTESDVITPGVWHHIAVVVASRTGTKKEVTVYVDGKSVPLTVKGNDKVQHLPKSHLLVANGLEGAIDEIRVWNRARTKEQIRKYMYRHCRGEFTAADGLVAEYSLDEGPGNRLAMSGDDYAYVKTERYAEGDNCAWISTSHLINAIDAEGQTKTADIGKDGQVKVWMRQGANLKSVKLTIHPNWPLAKFTYNGQPVTDDTSFDFSNGPVQLVPQDVEVFGRKYETPYTLTAEYDKSEACEFLSLAALKAYNPRLTEDDVQKAPISQNVSFALPGVNDLAAVRLSYTTSEGASVYYHGQPFESGKTYIDLRQPAVLEVVSANKVQANRYSVRVGRQQTIEHANIPASMNYGEQADLQLRASSGLPVQTISSDNDVLSLNAGVAYARKAGTARITYWQEGNSTYGPTERREAQVEVKPRSIVVTPVAAKMDFATPPPKLAYQYSWVANSWEKAKLDSVVESKVTYKFYQGATQWDGNGYLAAGEHAWKPNSTAVIRWQNYEITPGEGKVTVEAKDMPKLTLTILDGATPLEGALVRINAAHFRTGNDGKVSIPLPYDPKSLTEYVFVVSKDGYSPYKGQWKATKDGEAITIQLVRLEIELRYTAGANGSLLGETVQNLPRKGTGKPVLAAPALGYRFDKWSDGKSDNPRTDADVEASINVTANFVVISPTITYKALPGGKVEGETEHVVHPTGPVTVTATADPGYHFITWSDGVETATRTDDNVSHDQILYAQFTLDRELPYRENFNAYEHAPEGWLNRDRTGNGAWVFGSHHVGQLGVIGDGNFVSINSQKTGPDRLVLAELMTPWIDLTKSSGDITLAYEYKYKTISIGVHDTEGIFTYYTVDGVNWIQLLRIHTDDAMEAKPVSLTIQRSQLSGANSIRFKWRYQHTWDFAFLFDNVRVETQTVTSYKVMYVADEGGTVECQESLPAVRQTGEKGPQVVAKPNAGYRFVTWSDGVAEATRQDDHFVIARAIFARTLSSTVFDVQYTAQEGGIIEGLSLQRVAEGEDGAFVTAKPLFGYRFAKWNDGKTEPSRKELNVRSELTITAEFERLTHRTVTFAPAEHGSFTLTRADGTVLASGDQCPEGSSLLLKVVPDRGYQLASVKVNGNAMPISSSKLYRLLVGGQDIQLEVAFAPIEHTLVFASSKGGSITGSALQRVADGGNAEVVTAVPEAGHQFLRWSNGETSPELALTAVSASATYVAYFGESQFLQVRFDAMGGSPVPDVHVKQGAKVVAPAQPIRKGYKFAQWCTDRACTSAFDFDTEITSSLVLYAKWTPITYTISFDANSGGGSMEALAMRYDEPQSLPANKFTRSGFTFVGWALSASGAVQYNDGVSVMNLHDTEGADLKLYAQWVAGTPTMRNVTFNSHEGSEVAAQKVVDGQKASKPVDPMRTGYTFVRWYADAEYATEYDFNAPVNADIELHAKWAPNTYTLHFDPTKGWGSMYDQTIEYGTETPITMNQFVRDTYSFAGWALAATSTEIAYADGACVKNLSEIDATVIPLYAVWSEVFHKVTFESNGGSSVDAQSVRSGQAATKPADPEQEGFRFDGWYTDAKFSQLYNFATPVTGDLTLYAAWAPIKAYYMVTFAKPEHGALTVTSNGKELATGAKVADGSKVIITATPENGFELATLKANGADVTSGAEFTVSGDVVIEATFKAKETPVPPTPPMSEVGTSLLGAVTAAPNPFGTQLTVRGLEGVTRIQLISATGAVLLSQMHSQDPEMVLHTANLPSGMYLLRLSDEQGRSRTIRLVKE